MLSFIISMFIGQLALFVSHWIIYATIAIFFGITSIKTLIYLAILISFLSILFTLASVISYKYDNSLAKFLYKIAAIWIGFFPYYLFASILIWVIYLLNAWFNWASDMRYTAWLLFGLATLASLYGFFNAFFIRKIEIKVKIKNLPEKWHQKKALWVSDIHLGAIRNGRFANKVAKTIQTLNPAIVFIGGDLFDGVAVDAEGLSKPFAELETENGVYFITGNHEEFSDRRKFTDPISHSGIVILNNEMVEIDGVQIIGVDYMDNKHAQDFEQTLKSLNIDKNKPSILLKHVPDNLHIAEQAGIDLQISGHTHKGQMFPFGYIASRVFQGYAYGLKKFKNMLIYVSSGVGTWGPPMRVGTKPEIILISFEND